MFAKTSWKGKHSLNVCRFGLISEQKETMTQRGRRVYVLFKGNELVGVWSNLLYLCKEMKEERNAPFPSYSTLSKMDKLEGVLEFVKGGHTYKIYVQVVR